jgi:hypothetical protein
MTPTWSRVRLGAVLYAATAVVTLGVAVGLIGLGVLSDRTRFLQMALENPGPILLQDALKVPFVAALTLLVMAFHRRLAAERPRHMRVATGAGMLSILALLSNGLLSAYAVTNAARMSAEAGARLNSIVGVLALLALLASGVWYLLSHVTARRAAALPVGVCRLGMAVGVLSLLPPLAIFALALSIVWSVALLRAARALEIGSSVV